MASPKFAIAKSISITLDPADNVPEQHDYRKTADQRYGGKFKGATGGVGRTSDTRDYCKMKDPSTTDDQGKFPGTGNY